MVRALFDLGWWLFDRTWRFARAWTGDDAYDRYLADHRRDDAGTPAISRAAFYSHHLEEKWRRHTACGRFFD